MGIVCSHGRPHLTGWGVGQWGVDPWDSMALPGPIIGTKLFVLKLNAYGAYPASGTAEIQVRDYLDRTNHTFHTFAKLHQLATDGNLSDFAWVFQVDGVLYVSLVVSWTPGVNSYFYSPTKVVLYRLDSVDADLVGHFTLLGTRTMGTAGGQTAWSNYYYSGTTTYPDYYTSGCYNCAYNPGTPGTYNDYYGAHTYPAEESNTGDMFLLPFDRTLAATQISYTEHFSAAVTAMGSNLLGSKYFVKHASYQVTFSGLVGAGMVGVDPDTDPNLNSALLLTGQKFLGMSTTYPGWSNNVTYAHPVAFSDWNGYALMWGSYQHYTDYSTHGWGGTAEAKTFLIDQSRTFRDITFPAYATGDAWVGLWGDLGAVIFRKAGSSGVNYTQFYVLKGGDTAAAHKYSIFAGLNADGTITHIEGVEDVTPSIWLDDTKLSDMN